MIKKILSSSWIGIVLFMYSPILILAVYSFWTPDNWGIGQFFLTKLYYSLYF